MQTVGELKFEILYCYSCDNEFVLIFIHFWLKLAIKKGLLKENLNYYGADCYLVLCSSFGLQYEGIWPQEMLQTYLVKNLCFYFFLAKKVRGKALFQENLPISFLFVCLFVCK